MQLMTQLMTRLLSQVMSQVMSQIMTATMAMNAEAEMTETETMVHGSWFGVGDGTIVVWSLVWVVLPLGLVAIAGLLWAGKTGHFKNIQEIADRQLDVED